MGGFSLIWLWMTWWVTWWMTWWMTLGVAVAVPVAVTGLNVWLVGHPSGHPHATRLATLRPPGEKFPQAPEQPGSFGRGHVSSTSCVVQSLKRLAHVGFSWPDGVLFKRLSAWLWQTVKTTRLITGRWLQRWKSLPAISHQQGHPRNDTSAPLDTTGNTDCDQKFALHRF